MSRLTSRRFIALAALTSLAIPATSHAQFGGLIKRKIAQTAINKAIPQPAAPADTQAQRRTTEDADRKARQQAWDHPTPITAGNLGNFMTAIRAQQAERAKAAAVSGSPLGRIGKYDTGKRQCARDLAVHDTALKKLQKEIEAVAASGKYEKLGDYTERVTRSNNEQVALSTKCSAIQKPELTDADFAVIRAEDAHEDSVGAVAGGFTSLEYARLRERVVAYVLMPASWKPSGYSADELKVIESRHAEIRKSLGNDYDSAGQRNSVGN